MALFLRAYRLKIQLGSTRKIYQNLTGNKDALKIDFEIKMSAGQNFSNGSVSVAGLTQTDIIHIATNRTKEGILKDSYIELEAGYPNLISLLLAGNLCECEANLTGADKIIKMQINSAFEAGNTQISDSIKGSATFKDICELVAKNNKLTLNFDRAIPNKTIGDYSFNGTPYAQIQNLRQYMGDDVLISVKNKTLDVASTTSIGKRSFKISNENGLIGDPQITAQGITIKTLLNGAYQPNDFIHLESAKIKQLSGLYRIFEVKHSGSNYGELYQTEMLIRNA